MIDVSASGHYVGDCRDLLKQLPDGCVQACITSPPFYGLRDYGTAKWEGGEPTCDHSRVCGGTGSSTLHKYGNGSTAENVAKTIKRSFVPYRSKCRKCGAVWIDQQIGLEPTPEAFVETLVDVFRDVRRVLRDDGTLWLNLGDCYAHDNRGGHVGSSTALKGRRNAGATHRAADARGGKPHGYKSKDLIGIPWMAAFALRADGWYLRSDIIWHKANPMPESVTDRPTKAHEYLFLLSKSERYFYDAKAIAEPAGGWNGSAFDDGKNLVVHPNVQRRSGNKHRVLGDDRGRPGSHLGSGIPWEGTTRNKRSVWTVATKPYAGAHFAVMPEALAEPCILAGCPAGGTVLDPFAGSGTVGRVALKHGRSAVLCDLNPEYVALQAERTTGVQVDLLTSRGAA
jgi:DNA modification methylase